MGRGKRLTIGGCQESRAETAWQGAVPDVPPLGARNPGGGAFTFLRKLCYDVPAERVRLQEQKLWGIFSGQEVPKTFFGLRWPKLLNNLWLKKIPKIEVNIMMTKEIFQMVKSRYGKFAEAGGRKESC
ncbi:MAG: hypothetical protein ACLPT6_00915 [Desulfobaccales bacterium]